VSAWERRPELDKWGNRDKKTGYCIEKYLFTVVGDGQIRKGMVAKGNGSTRKKARAVPAHTLSQQHNNAKS